MLALVSLPFTTGRRGRLRTPTGGAFRFASLLASIHDLHATVLRLLGVDHEKLTYRYAGGDFRLTDVYGHVVSDVIA